MSKMVVLLALTLAATVEAGYRVVRLTEVIVLAREGVSDRTIISYLENRELAFMMGTDEILRLRDAGAGEAVIRYLIERTAPRDSYASETYADRSRFSYYDRSPYDEHGYEGAYIEYDPSYAPSYYVGASIGPYLTFDRYYPGGLGGWLARTLGFGHRAGRYYDSRYDRGWSHGRHYGYGYAGGSNLRYRESYGRQPGHGYRASPYAHEHAVPRGRGDGGRHYEGGHPRPSRGHTSGRGRH